MTRRNACMIIAFLCLALSVCYSISGFAEDIPLNFLLSGESQSFADIRLSSPSFDKLSQFDDSRVTALNRLLQHIAVGICTDGSCTTATVFIDNDPVSSITEAAEGNYIRSVYSVDPDTAYRKTNVQESGNTFQTFLDKQFFTANRMIDELYNVFSKMENAFPDLAKQSASGINYKGFGKAVRKVTIQFSSDDVREYFPGKITELTENDECCKFIGQYKYYGPQKIILLYNQENQLMSVVYNGILGLSENTQRRVSLNWKCIRENGKIKDSIALKTPSVKGYDKYNVSYVRELDFKTDERYSLTWDFQLDYKENNDKQKLQYDGIFTLSDEMLAGNIRYKVKQDGQESCVEVSSLIHKENEQAYQGTIEITNKKGKIVISSIKTLISAFLSGTVTAPDPELTIMDCDGEEGDTALASVRMKIYGTLMQRLITLPAADTEFLRDGIPEQEWNSIMQSMNQ